MSLGTLQSARPTHLHVAASSGIRHKLRQAGAIGLPVSTVPLTAVQVRVRY